MADRGHAADEILQRAPPQPDGLGHAKVLADGAALGMVDVAGPFGGVSVGTATERRKEIELQVVMRVNQSGQQFETRQIENRTRTCESHRRVDRAIRTAGVRHAASKSSGLPAC